MILEFRARRPGAFAFAALIVSTAFVSVATRADEPYARSRDYALQDIRTHLWFDLDHRTVRGEVTESVAALRDNVGELKLDSVDLKIESVRVDGKAAEFHTDAKQLIVSLDHPVHRGEKRELFIRYQGQPRKGLYFILPDANYPQQPKEIWTQGEAEDTRYYIPLYDYPNDRLTSEMLLTVPASWVTVSNGRLMSVSDESNGMKTWDWKQSEPLSTYLISAVAGEFVEHDDSWHGLPLRYLVPRGSQDDIDPTFSRTKEMLDLFSSRLGVPYPWAQFAQTTVDDFVAGGMENTSAVTLTANELVNPKLAAEDYSGADDVTSHELAHQWFGDLVTCKDWANLWLNEGFATFLEHFWMEQHYSPEDAAYEYWREQNGWFRQPRLFPVPIVDRDFDDSTKYEGNIYDKGGWVLKMLREKLGDDDFFRGLRNYLEVNRGQNVVTADLQKAIEESISINVDEFFRQWVYRAGAPEFDIAYSYDSAARQVKLDVKQTQKIEGVVGLFDVPIDVEISTASGRKTYPIRVTKASDTFTFPADSEPRMVLFDRGDEILKKVDFNKDPAALVYQLKNADTVPDRADAAVALAAVHNGPDVVAALGDSARHDTFWGVRVESLRALGRVGGADAENQILTALNDEKTPWVRSVAARQLGGFKDDASLPAKVAEIAANDPAYRVRGQALVALGQLKAPSAFDTLSAAVNSESPDDTIRISALGALGLLGDDRGVPILLEWSAAGKPFRDREEAIAAVADLDRKDKNITQALVSCLREPYFDIRFAAILALGARGDFDAIGPLQDMLKSDQLTVGEEPFIQASLTMLKAQAASARP